jgi:hypothetical protein
MLITKIKIKRPDYSIEPGILITKIKIPEESIELGILNNIINRKW